MKLFNISGEKLEAVGSNPFKLEKDIQSLINQSFKGPLKTYMLACHQEGYIGRFGGTVSPSSYSLNFPASNVSLLWIPKNGCTTLKRSLVELEPLEAQKHIKIKKILLYEDR